MAKKETLLKRNHSEWLELCEWVQLNIFEYEMTQKIQQSAWLVLEGLRKGQDIAKNSEETYGEYPVNVILLTFKANKVKILNAIRGKDFKTETAKMQYVCKIVRDNLNDIYTRYLNSQKSKEKMQHINTDILEHQGAEYQNTIKNKEDKKFEGLW